MPKPLRQWSTAVPLALGGGLAFWLANLAISLTPVAAHYRAAVGIAYLPMLLQALAGGLLLAFGVSYALRRFYSRIPASSALAKSLLLSLVVFAAVTLLLEAPAKFFTPASDAWRSFLTAATFNAVRLTALGLAVGALYHRFQTRATSSLRSRSEGGERA